LPERNFFFTILASVQTDYLKGVIAEAHKLRFKEGQEQKASSVIMIKDSWLAELTKYPYISSKFYLLIVIEKKGTGVFLLKERTKLVKVKKNVIKHTLQRRMTGRVDRDEEMKRDDKSTARR
jgi:hypothetical protein